MKDKNLQIFIDEGYIFLGERITNYFMFEKELNENKIILHVNIINEHYFYCLSYFLPRIAKLRLNTTTILLDDVFFKEDIKSLEEELIKGIDYIEGDR